MNEARQKISTEISQELNECRASINVFLGDVINDWSLDCQHKSDTELARSYRRIRQLRSDFSQVIGAYVQAVETDQLVTPMP